MKCFWCNKYFYKNETMLEAAPPKGKQKYYIIICPTCKKEWTFNNTNKKNERT